jgi:hypothetical protein
MTTKTTLSYEDYLKLLGLLTLARGHNKALADITRAVVEITGEMSDSATGVSHSSEAVVCDYEAHDLLRRLGLSVAPPDRPQ